MAPSPIAADETTLARKLKEAYDALERASRACDDAAGAVPAPRSPPTPLELAQAQRDFIDAQRRLAHIQHEARRLGRPRDRPPGPGDKSWGAH